MRFLLSCVILFAFSFCVASAQNSNEKAEAILQKALNKIGGERYLQIKTIISEGNFTTLRDGAVLQFQTFLDVIVLPDKERTDFKSSGEKIVQVNIGSTGWVADTLAEKLQDQTPQQIESFKKSLRTSIHNLLHGYWRKEGASLSYVGRRQASVGKRNDVIKLSYPDGFDVEYEISDEGLPVKVIYKSKNSEGEEIKEEDRYAQFVEVQGILTPFIVDHYENDTQIYRVNYKSIVYNKSVPDSIFQKPNSIKDLKKDLKF